ncbi:MAG: hypothetical protein CMH83_12115 [Nocardioides sp.]|nr:hypothetical protein [Nocardioides sp.]
MTHRLVQPHHVLRAVLDDVLVRDVLARCDVDVAMLRTDLDLAWWSSVDCPDVLGEASAGLDLETVRAALEPSRGWAAAWGDRRPSEGTRTLLRAALVRRSRTGCRRPVAGHVLLAAATSEDPVLRAALTPYRKRLRPASRLVAQWGRRAA